MSEGKNKLSTKIQMQKGEILQSEQTIKGRKISIRESAGKSKLQQDINRINCTEDNLFRKKTKSKLSSPSQEQKQNIPKADQNQNNKRQCRICLEDEKEGRMYNPCKCSGSVTYAHQKCMKQWIKRKYNPRYPKTIIKCEMCNAPLNYKLAVRRQFNLNICKTKFEKEKFTFLLYLFFAIAMLAAAIILSIMISLGNGDSEFSKKIRQNFIKNESLRIVYICVVFFICIMLMFLIILFLIEYCFSAELIVKQVHAFITQSEFKNQKKGKQIYPKQYQLVQSSSESSSYMSRE